jgi:hypothetical protein
VASLVSTEFSIVSGGLACVVGALLLNGLLPGSRRYGHDTDVNAGVDADADDEPSPGSSSTIGGGRADDAD